MCCHLVNHPMFGYLGFWLLHRKDWPPGAYFVIIYKLPNVSSLKLVYSKQPTIGLTQEFCWMGACVGGGGELSKQLRYQDEVRERSVIVN